MGQLQELEAVLTLEHERAQATPAMRLLDEVGAGYECVCVCRGEGDTTARCLLHRFHVEGVREQVDCMPVGPSEASSISLLECS